MATTIQLNVKNSNIINTAKAWVNFNGIPTTPTIRAGYNVSSISKLSTGRYRVTYTNPMSNSNYSLMGMGQGPFSSTRPGDFKVSVIGDSTSANMTSSYVDIETGSSDETVTIDAYMASVIIFNSS